MRAELEDLGKRWPVGEEFDLNTNSVVYIVGGYKGITTEFISQLYAPRLIRAYEPQDWAFKVLQEVAMAYTNIEAYHYALGDVSASMDMGEWGTDACSFVNTGSGSREHGNGTMVPIEWTMQDQERIDLMMINCEGYEFKLLPYMREKGLLGKVRALCIQWHLDLTPELTEERMDQEIANIGMDGYILEFDERPSWTLHVRNDI